MWLNIGLSILKNHQNAHYPRFSSIPITGIAFPKRGLWFYCAPTTVTSEQTAKLFVGRKEAVFCYRIKREAFLWERETRVLWFFTWQRTAVGAGVGRGGG